MIVITRIKITQSLFCFIIILIISSCSGSSKDEVAKLESEVIRLKKVVQSKENKNIMLQNEIDDYLLKIKSFKKPKEGECDIKFKSLVHSSSGRWINLNAKTFEDTYAYNYRVDLYQSEIYKSIYVTKLEYYEEGSIRIIFETKINIVQDLDISSESTGSLTFDSWLSSNEFLISIDGNQYKITINDNMNYLIEKNKTTPNTV